MAEVTVTLALTGDEVRALKRLLDRPSQETFEDADNLGSLDDILVALP